MAKNLDYGVEQDMTPMIDIVFLLIIFFMVVTELTLNQAELVLMVAPQAKIIEPDPGQRVVPIDISLDPEDPEREIISIKGGPNLAEGKDLVTTLRAEVAAYDQYEPKPNNPAEKNSALAVVIRCDRHADMKALTHVFAACAEATIYKVSLAAQNERLENPYDLME